MNRRELANLVAEYVGMNGEKVDEVLEWTFKLILLRMSAQNVGPIVIRNFGTFQYKPKSPGKRYDPRTKTYVDRSSPGYGVRPCFTWSRTYKLYFQRDDKWNSKSTWWHPPKANIER